MRKLSASTADRGMEPELTGLDAPPLLLLLPPSAQQMEKLVCMVGITYTYIDTVLGFYE